jgi:GMP synthase-like glutamine amidotransferase
MKVNNESVSELPKEAQVLGHSTKTQNEIWQIPNRVLCFQSSPEINKTYIKELIINKLYDIGKLDDNQKNQSLE